MIRLNLPSYDIKLRGTEGHYQVLDPLRRRWVALTPEEWVRQHFIHWLTSSLGYPTALLANEVPLRIGSKDLRADSVLYDRTLKPRMIIEFKAPHIPITQRTIAASWILLVKNIYSWTIYPTMKNFDNFRQLFYSLKTFLLICF